MGILYYMMCIIWKLTYCIILLDYMGAFDMLHFAPEHGKTAKIVDYMVNKVPFQTVRQQDHHQ